MPRAECILFLPPFSPLPLQVFYIAALSSNYVKLKLTKELTDYRKANELNNSYEMNTYTPPPVNANNPYAHQWWGPDLQLRSNGGTEGEGASPAAPPPEPRNSQTPTSHPNSQRSRRVRRRRRSGAAWRPTRPCAPSRRVARLRLSGEMKKRSGKNVWQLTGPMLLRSFSIEILVFYMCISPAGFTQFWTIESHSLLEEAFT